MKSEFFDQLIERAKKDPQRIAFPETDAERILRAAERLVQMKAAIPVLIGEEEAIRNFASTLGISLAGMEFVDNTDEAVREQLVQEYITCCDLLSEKNIARKIRYRENFAAALVKVERADCFVSGYQCTTAETVVAAQNIIGLQPGISTVSSLCMQETGDWIGSEGNLLCITDCVVTPEPDSEALADIAISACETMKKLMKWEPRAAFLSYSTLGSGNTDNVLKVVKAVEIAKAKRPDLKIDGEFQIDAAVDPMVAAKKVKRPSAVAGRANILVFPDLNAGNIAAKIFYMFAKQPGHGALLAGLTRPCIDLSRSAPLEQIVGACIMLAVIAQEK